MIHTSAGEIKANPNGSPYAQIDPRLEIALLLVPAVVLGAIVRLVPILGSDFPLNGGALFLVMSQDLREANFALPAVTSYNFDAIPFAYPPLGIYLLAALEGTGLDPIQLLRWLPLAASILTIPLVYVVAKELLGSWRIAAVAAVVYALLPRSYEWLITGGGITRSFGALLALLAIWQGIRLIRTPSRTHLALTGLLGGLTLLTHPEASLFVAVTLVAFVLSFGRTPRIIGLILGAGLIGVLVALPWWWTVMSQHDASVLAAAADSRTVELLNALRRFLFGQFTGASELDIFLGIGFIGLLTQLARRRYLLPAWLVAIVLVIVAAGFTFAAVPWAMLTAVAIADLILPAIRRLLAPQGPGHAILLAGLVGAGVLSSLATGYGTSTPIHAISMDQRVAMSWIDANTPTDSRFVVMSGIGWQIDASSEWFPALARRHSVATPQGYEWTGQFPDRERAHQLLQSFCAIRPVQCLNEWIDVFGVDANYVYIPQGQLAGLASPPDCCPALREDLREQFNVVYDGPGATIVEIQDSGTGP